MKRILIFVAIIASTLAIQAQNRMDTINLGRAWTVNSKNGGPVAVMNTRSGYVQESDTLELKWVQQLKIIHKIGESFRQAIIKSNIFQSAFAAANLLGDPEFEMWLGKPSTFDIVFNPTETGIQLSGDVPESVSLVASNGIPSKTIRKYAQSGDIINSFNEGEFCISLWKSNYLPIITLFGQNGSLEISKKYIVRNAILGNDSSSVSSSRVYTVKNGGKLEIEAMDDISTYAGFVIEKGGEVILRCDRDVNLNGVIVKNGGKLTVYARNVEMGKNFKVDNGGIFQIF